MPRPDLDSPEQIAAFVDRFYARLLADPALRPIFIDAAAIDLPTHLPRIRAYWRKMLLGERGGYQRHTMNIHRAVHARRPFSAADFERWLALFTETLDSYYAGPVAERARRLASRIAANMQAGLDATSDEGQGMR
ncbi:group III truncated hemoglobin [Pseudohaliea rubra]|uniref:SEC-independent protein translocase protein TATC n=1 Tax=Pseudohaliea rubra DSM 19751 TaxID=1265313 RepID=A0A095VUE0_9GAMM|nr:group III truncated hemoglobin [Pseudohaliea rubra]KGE04985.1 SEC-independent protein translocase protein TATC [Pseudohaliea rubra DSM 19751]